MKVSESRSSDCYCIQWGNHASMRFVRKDSNDVEDRMLIEMCEHILKIEFALESHKPLIVRREDG